MANNNSLNFSNMHDEVISIFNHAFQAIMDLAAAEKELKEVSDNYPADSYTKQERADLLKAERAAVKTAKEKANNTAILAVSRYLSTTDYLEGNIYNFDVESFLRNIGVLEGELDNLKKSHIKKVETFRGAVVDRVRYTVTRRKKGESNLTWATTKAVKNTPVELVLALIYSFCETGCFTMGSAGFSKVDFENTEA